MKIKVNGMMLVLLLVMFTLAVNTRPVEAVNTIYIRADGSIDPPTSRITTTDNVTYSLTDNINDSIVVEKDDIILDGAGYILRGTGSEDGIFLAGRINITIKNTEIESFGYAVYLSSVSHCTFSGNNVTDSQVGFEIRQSSENNIFYGNNIVDNGIGLEFYQSHNNTLSGNTIENSYCGVDLRLSLENRFFHNNFINNTNHIQLRSSFNNSWDNGCEGNYWSDYNGTDLSNVGAGIKPGDWIEYELNWTVSPPEPYNVGVRREVLDLDGTIVTFNITEVTSDGNVTSSIREGDIANGTGAAQLVVIPSNLEPGDFVRTEHFGSILIDGTAQRTYLGVERTVLWANFTGFGIDLLIFWDKMKGMSLEILHSRTGAQGTTKVTKTNLWEPDGIGDTRYIIDANNTDHYPLMNRYWNPCDINHDLRVDMTDLGSAARAFGTEPDDDRWDPHADITGTEYLVPNGKVDMRDIGLIARSFGEEYP